MKTKGNSSQIKFWRVPHLDNLDLMHAWDVTYDYPRHVHEEYALGIIIAGAETHICRGTSYKAFSGDLMLTNPEEAHSNKSVGTEYRILAIRPEMLNRIACDITGQTHETPYFANPIVKDSLMFRLLLNLHFKLEQNASPLEMESEFISTIGLLLGRQNRNKSISQSVGKERGYIKLVQDYLKSHAAENVSLAELAAITSLSPFHLLRVFRNQVGVPPHEYQTQIRIIRARRLIRTGHSILDAALETGFFDQSHLSRNFKRIVGITPSQYISQSNIVQDRAA